MTTFTPRILLPSPQLPVKPVAILLLMPLAFALLLHWPTEDSYAFSPSGDFVSAVPQVAQAEVSPPAEEDVRKQAEETRRARDTFLREERVLIRRGELQLELSTFYSMDSRDQLIAVPGGNSLLVKSENREV